MRMYVVYEKPKDYPDSFVVRGWSIRSNGLVADPHLIATEDTLEAAREKIPVGLVRILPSKNDDPVIAEVWI